MNGYQTRLTRDFVAVAQPLHSTASSHPNPSQPTAILTCFGIERRKSA